MRKIGATAKNNTTRNKQITDQKKTNQTDKRKDSENKKKAKSGK